jgi:dipeptidyl aminopeptidase/acylaminoacyl peptidase
MSDLRGRLRTVPVPDEDAARERTARALASAYAQRRPARSRRRLTPLAATLAALSLTAAALAASGQGGAVTRWLGDLVDPPPPAQRLDRLPAPGRLLAVSAEGAWLIEGDGDRHALGDFADATWSPQGLFVAGVHGSQLSTVDPAGELRWTLTATAPVRDPRWGPDGFRIAYRSGPSLRVVAGDGSGDRLIAERVVPLAAAWRPDDSHALAYVTAGGRLRLAMVDDGTATTMATGLRDARWIGWAAGGLLAATPRRLVTARRPGAAWRAPAGAAIATAALSPGGDRIAVLLRGSGHARLLLVDARTLRAGRTLTTFAGGARALTWSPDGRWLVAAQPRRGRWLLVPLARGARPRALTGLGAALGGPAARALPRGWCCAP